MQCTLTFRRRRLFRVVVCQICTVVTTALLLRAKCVTVDYEEVTLLWLTELFIYQSGDLAGFSKGD